jgi:hypothetical protein
MNNRVGQFYDVDNSHGIAANAVVGVDESEMSATAVISTPTWDRQRDSLNPLGGRYDHYRLNPVVMWDHGLEIVTPIAKSKDSEGNLLVYPSAEGIRAKSIFSQRNKVSEQIFALLADDIVHATSIRFKPLSRPKSMANGQRYDEWEMEEWSWCGLGVNPEAVRDVIAKGRLAGSPIDGSLLKSLRGSVPATRKTKVTWSQKRPTMKRKSHLKVNDILDPKKPYGSQLLIATHSHLKSVSHGLSAGMTNLENPRITELLNGVKGMLSEVTSALEGGFAEEYPEVAEEEELKCNCPNCRKAEMGAPEDEETPPASGDLFGPEEEPEEEMEDEEEVLKSYLAVANMHRYQVGALTSDLKNLATSDNLTSQQKAVVVNLNNRIATIVKEAYRRQVDGPANDEMEAKVKSLADQLAQMTAALDQALPHSRR